MPPRPLLHHQSGSGLEVKFLRCVVAVLVVIQGSQLLHTAPPHHQLETDLRASAGAAAAGEGGAAAVAAKANGFAGGRKDRLALQDTGLSGKGAGGVHCSPCPPCQACKSCDEVAAAAAAAAVAAGSSRGSATSGGGEQQKQPATKNSPDPKNADLLAVFVLETRGTGVQGIIENVRQNILPDTPSVVYVCVPDGTVAAVRDIVATYGDFVRVVSLDESGWGALPAGDDPSLYAGSWGKDYRLMGDWRLWHMPKFANHLGHQYVLQVRGGGEGGVGVGGR